MSCSVLDKDIGGNKEGGTAHLESVAELASDLPHHSAPKTAGRQQGKANFELACTETAHHAAPHDTNQGRHCRR